MASGRRPVASLGCAKNCPTNCLPEWSGSAATGGLGGGRFLAKRGSITLTCLGCLGIVFALIVLSLLKGCVSGLTGSARIPAVDEKLEFSVQNNDHVLEVSRPLQMARLVTKGRSAIYSLVRQPGGYPASPGWLIRDQERSYVRVDARRTQGLGGNQEGLGGRLRDIWMEWGEDDFRQKLDQVLPPLSQLGGSFQGSSLSLLKGPAWEGQETLQLTYARRVMGSGVIALPVGWKYHQVAYAPASGLVLNRQDSDREADSVPDEALFVNAGLSHFKLEHFRPDHFQPPAGYQERYSDREIEKDTPRTPFYKKPPRDYGQIGVTGYSREGSVTCIREEYLQKNSNPRYWKFEIFLYLLDHPKDVDPFLGSLNLGWLGFKGWDPQPLAPERTAVLKSGFLLSKKNRLVRLDLKYFERGGHGEHSAEKAPEARQEIQTLARELSEGL